MYVFVNRKMCLYLFIFPPISFKKEEMVEAAGFEPTIFQLEV
jgi:hypothetical protein